MKRSATKAILYDDNCPMCALYTRGFVQWGVLSPENRIAFTQAGQQLDAQVLETRLDACRARHEIPLVDLAGGPTLYGIDAMVYLLRQRIPYVGQLMRVKPVRSFFRFLYNLVSYNRRIMVPGSVPAGAFDCAPDFHAGYRLAFVAYAVTLAALVTYAFGWSVAAYIPAENSGGKMLLMCGTGWVMQMVLAVLFLKDKKMDYLGHLAVLMILGVGVLVPGIGLTWLTKSRFPLIPVSGVLVSSALMSWQHFRRVNSLKLSQWWTVVWFCVLQGTAAFWAYAFWVSSR